MQLGLLDKGHTIIELNVYMYDIKVILSELIPGSTQVSNRQKNASPLIYN